jgi:site-specific recombinase XerD
MKTQFTTQVLKLQKELEFRNYSKQTIKNYCFSMLNFEQRMAKPLNELVIDDLKNYLHDRIIIEKVSTSFVNSCISAFKIHWEDVLRKEWEELKIKRPRVASKLPVVLSVEEIEKMISLTTNIKHKALITVMYSAGLRRAEVLNLKIGDIDSGRMMIRVNQGKGKKDRNTILSPKALDLLRKYYKRYKPKLHLFEAVSFPKNTTIQK